MAAKSAEQYVEYALKHFSEHHKTAVRVIQELRAAGWLRSSPWVESASEERIATLTRERDEARVDREAWARAYRRALASAASPEVMRVIDALAAYKRLGGHLFTTAFGLDPAAKEVADAYNAYALSASRQPKAQEPRWVAKRGTNAWCVLKNEEVAAVNVTQYEAERIADILNADGAK